MDCLISSEVKALLQTKFAIVTVSLQNSGERVLGKIKKSGLDMGSAISILKMGKSDPEKVLLF